MAVDRVPVLKRCRSLGLEMCIRDSIPGGPPTGASPLGVLRRVIGALDGVDPDRNLQIPAALAGAHVTSAADAHIAGAVATAELILVIVVIVVNLQPHIHLGLIADGDIFVIGPLRSYHVIARCV